jgi:hypothetical protein
MRGRACGAAADGAETRAADSPVKRRGARDGWDDPIPSGERAWAEESRCGAHVLPRVSLGAVFFTEKTLSVVALSKLVLHPNIDNLYLYVRARQTKPAQQHLVPSFSHRLEAGTKPS